MRKAAISIMPACLVVALGGLSVTPSVAQVAEPPPDSSFQKVTLEDSPGEPMDLVVLPDLRVLHTTVASYGVASYGVSRKLWGQSQAMGSVASYGVTQAMGSELGSVLGSVLYFTYFRG